MKAPSKKLVWIEVLFLSLLGLSQIQCSQQMDTFSLADPNAVPNPKVAERQAGEAWTEVKTMEYKGLFHAQALFVLDNSGSMQEELAQYINSRIQTFMSNMGVTAGLTYKIGITNTNYNVDFGRLISANNGQTILTQMSDSSLFPQMFAKFTTTINAPGSGNERGLAAAAAAVQRERANLFSEPPADAALSRRVVIISDADDTDSTAIENYTSVLAAVPNLSMNAIIGIPTKPCTNPAQEGFGYRYVDAVAQVGGNVSSICRADFNASLDRVFSWIQNVCMELSEPVSSRDSIVLTVDGQVYNDYTLDAAKTSVCMPMPNRRASLRLEAYHEATN